MNEFITPNTVTELVAADAVGSAEVVGEKDGDVVVNYKWFCAQVQAALDDPRPAVPHEEVKKEFAALRAELAVKQMLRQA
ncbi:hypothetical protein AAKU67_000149 [Oxalobacteraceae bacterium GrIS 2.11]